MQTRTAATPSVFEIHQLLANITSVAGCTEMVWIHIRSITVSWTCCRELYEGQVAALIPAKTVLPCCEEGSLLYFCADYLESTFSQSYKW